MYFWLVFCISFHCVSPPLRQRWWRRRWSSIVVVTAGFATNPSGIGSTSLPLHLTNTPAQKLIIAPPQNTTPNTVPNSTSYYSSIAARSFRGFRFGSNNVQTLKDFMFLLPLNVFAVSYGNEVSSNHTLRGKNVFIAINTHDSHCISLNICSHINTLKANFSFLLLLLKESYNNKKWS